MQPSWENQQIKVTLKRLMKNRRLTYEDLARHLDLSLATVKRILNGEDMNIERLVRIANWLQVELKELMELSLSETTAAHSFTEDQELLLAEDTESLELFMHLVKRQPIQTFIQRKAMTKDQVLRLTKKLEQAGLANRLEENRIKLAIKWPFRIKDGGPFMKKYWDRLMNTIFHDAYRKAKTYAFGKKIEEPVFYPYEILLRPKTAQRMKNDLVDLVNRYKEQSKAEMAYLDADELSELSGLIIANNQSPWTSILAK